VGALLHLTAEVRKHLMDALIIGGGPGGLTAAVYLARYLRNVLVIEDGRSRALWIPRSHNCPGYPDGIPGPELLERLRRQAARFDASILAGEVEALEREDDTGSFLLSVGPRRLRARTVILATGADDIQPPIADLAGAVRRGLLRYCPACDAYEARDRAIGILGARTCRMDEARLLRSYTADLTMLSLREPLELDEEERTELQAMNIGVVDEPVDELLLESEAISARLAGGGRVVRFGTIYAALGLRGRSGLATALGAEHDPDGMLLVDEHQQTSVPGLYAIGDVVPGLTQIGVAMGQAAIAASAINRTLGHRPRAAG
jgi:thioredoxin reductase (NADPH)